MIMVIGITALGATIALAALFSRLEKKQKYGGTIRITHPNHQNESYYLEEVTKMLRRHQDYSKILHLIAWGVEKLLREEMADASIEIQELEIKYIYVPQKGKLTR